MKNSKLHFYSIMPLDIKHVDEICEDIRYQYENGITSCALFEMTLVPEGNPPIDKAAILCKKYDLFQEKLSAMGIPSGILVQASIGHGWVLSEMFPYQKYTNLNNGCEESVVCPYDEGFKVYIYNALRTIAKHNPDHVMIDDDFRLIDRPGNGCGCALHMKRFNELAGTNITREELWDAICSGTDSGKCLERIFIETQRESVVETARIMRDGIDSVNPDLPGSFCSVGNNAEFGQEIAAILAGKNNPVVLRINNGNYCTPGARFFSNVFYRAATQIAKVRDGVDIVLAEPDTCPQNRYSTSAMSLHTHLTGSILEGVRGAKHWITRLAAYEPESGVAYRKILSRYHGFYETLADIVTKLKWRGCRIPVFNTYQFDISNDRGGVKETYNAWCSCVLERLGLPVYFSWENGGVTCLEGNMDELYTDEQVIELLKGKLFLASDTAEKLIKRGFGRFLGTDVRTWHGKQPSCEILSVNGNRTSVQMQIKELLPFEKEVTVDSIVYHTVDNENYEELFAGTTVYKNELGGTVFTFCGTPRANYNIVEAFSFLNYSRKKQLIRMLESVGELPIYYPGDEEVYFRCAEMEDGSLFCAVFNIGLDPIEETQLVCGRKVRKIQKLMPNGGMAEIDFKANDEKYLLKTPCYTLDPLILIIKCS